jgi:hypothetical protein
MKSHIDLFAQQAKGTAKSVKSQENLLVVITTSNNRRPVTNSQSRLTQNQRLFIQDRLYNLVVTSSQKCFKVNQTASLPNLYEKITKNNT